MSIQKIGTDSVKKTVFIVLSVIVTGCLGSAGIARLVFGGRPQFLYRIMAFALLLTAALFTLCVFKKYKELYIHHVPVYVSVILIFILSVTPRAFIISSVSAEQYSDYLTYYEIADGLFNTGEISGGWVTYAGAIAPTLPFICKMVSLSFYVGGSSVYTALIANILYSFIFCVCFYLILVKFIPAVPSLIGTTVLAVWPDFLFSSLFLLSEPMYMAFASLGLMFFIYAYKGSFTYPVRIIFLILSGVFLAVSKNIRPVTYIYIITVIFPCGIKYLRSVKTKTHFSHIAYVFVFIAVFLITDRAICAFTSGYLPVISKPSFAWSMFEGSNPYTYGQWSEETSATLAEIIADYPLEDVQGILLQSAFNQIVSYTVPDFIKLIANKIYHMWGGADLYITEYMNLKAAASPALHGEMPGLFKVWGNIFQQPLYALFVMGVISVLIFSVIRVLKSDYAYISRYISFLLPLCGGMLVHLVITAIPRYAYVWIPVLISDFLILFDGIFIRDN